MMCSSRALTKLVVVVAKVCGGGVRAVGVTMVRCMVIRAVDAGPDLDQIPIVKTRFSHGGRQFVGS